MDAKMPTSEVKATPHIESRSQPATKGLYNKPFPHYNTLLEIFGKDRANGLGATTLAQEEETIEATAGNEDVQSTQYDEGLDGIEVSSTQPQASLLGAANKKLVRTSIVGLTVYLRCPPQSRILLMVLWSILTK
ncbi:hypothetical protein L1049_016683 [Liquidambar formosana]|uniref:Uncharacterized protein n=1 Tax=Liquidambar formosana TaxID=63359 RepID=A0AAP0X0R9_LIQFO